MKRDPVVLIVVAMLVSLMLVFGFNMARRHNETPESKAAAKLHHTNIVPVFGVGEQDGLPYYVMQFIQGLGMNEVLAELNNMEGLGAAGGTGELPVSRRNQSAADVAHCDPHAIASQAAIADTNENVAHVDHAWIKFYDQRSGPRMFRDYPNVFHRQLVNVVGDIFSFN